MVAWFVEDMTFFRDGSILVELLSDDGQRRVERRKAQEIAHAYDFGIERATVPFLPDISDAGVPRDS